MNTERNRLMVLAISTRSAEKMLRETTAVRWYGATQHMIDERARALDSLDEIADTLEALAAAETTGATLGAREGNTLRFPTPVPLTCKKVKHFGEGYLHDADDDSPYDIDGCAYCGRCHVSLPHEVAPDWAELERVSELLVTHFGETTRSSVSGHLADVVAKLGARGELVRLRESILDTAAQLSDKLANLALSHPQHGTHHGRARELLRALQKETNLLYPSTFKAMAEDAAREQGSEAAT